MDSALHLFLNFIKKFKLAKNFDPFIDVLKMTLTVLLFALAKVEVFVSQRKVGEKKITDALGMCQAALKNWVEKVIRGTSFKGGDVEVKVCNLSSFLF